MFKVTMAGLSELDKRLGVEPITSIGDFKSPHAKKLIEEFSLTLDDIPELLKALNDHSNQFGQWVASDRGFLPEFIARTLAAKAVILYESAVRGNDFKLVIPGETSISRELYDHTTGVNPGAATKNENLGDSFARKAREYSRP